ncbi:MAG: DegV family protein [Chloroflexota bacterium]
MRIHIVTDSGAHFAHPQIATQYPMTTVPNTLVIGGQPYREGVDLSTEKLLNLIGKESKPPHVEPPSVDEYAAAYTRLAYHHDAIISIHMSRELSDSWKNAQAAAKQLEGHVQIHVIDSMMLDGAQGMVVRAAVRAIEKYDDIETIVRVVRGAADRAYAVYYVETPDFIARQGILSRSHAVLSAMTGTIPVVSIEGGIIVPIEKVRTRSQAIDRLVEFVIEFEDIEDALILQPGTFMSEHTRNLQDRLSNEFPGRHFPHAVYSATLATFLGTDATGLVVLESELDDEADEADIDNDKDDEEPL